MKNIFLLLVLFISPLFASPQTDYLKRFQTYLKYNQALPDNPDNEFLRFIEPDLPLSNKLRTRWLTHLAQKKQWTLFKQHYRKSNQIDLICFAELARYYTGNEETAMNTAKSLWLTSKSQPAACTPLFDLLLHKHNVDERYIDARIILAFNENNPELVSYLLKQYKIPRQNDTELLDRIMKDPSSIRLLPNDNFHGYFYVYGLKRLISQKKKSVFTLWEQALKERRLSEAQQQNFLTYLAIYKALRNEPDAKAWFEKVKPAFYNDNLLDWQIRLALKEENWKQVIRLIHFYRNKSDSCWQYWLGRALEAEGYKEQADAIYHKLAQKREYYGFLASLRLDHTFHFENEPSSIHLTNLQVYRSITDKILFLRQKAKNQEAATLINDFTSELPKTDKASFIYWVANGLHWYGKSIALSNTDELKNQLALRFPIAYRDIVTQMASKYQVPEAYIYAIIRQESAFQDTVSSPAGAIGLMQLMPTTASMVAKKVRLNYRNQAQLFHSLTNIHLGAAYLNFLALRFNSHPVLIAAAYNAGPRQVFYWLKAHPPKEIDIWIETLPWQETRNYLKNVVYFYAIYQYRIQKKASLKQVMKKLE